MTISRKKIIGALIVNIAIVIMEIIAMYLSLKRHSLSAFQYYTENSNYFTLFISLIFCIGSIIALKEHTYISNWIRILRFISTTCLAITMLIVLFILIPLFPENFEYMMFYDSNLYHHILCPILSILSFLLLENQVRCDRKSILYSMIPTLIYGVVLIILNIAKVVVGPYPFFYVYDMPWYASILCLLGILLAVVSIAIGIYYLHNIVHIKNDKTQKKTTK